MILSPGRDDRHSGRGPARPHARDRGAEGRPAHATSTRPRPRRRPTTPPPRRTVAPFDDEEALARFAEAVDVVTYEFENVPTSTVEFLSHARAGAAGRAGAWR